MSSNIATNSSLGQQLKARARDSSILIASLAFVTALGCGSGDSDGGPPDVLPELGTLVVTPPDAELIVINGEMVSQAFQVDMIDVDGNCHRCN